jgi:aspartate aminotransferase-like enzyme
LGTSNEKLLLMTPGPTEVSGRVIRAMMRPAIHHNDPRFVKLFDETEELLQKIFRTQNHVVLFPGSGRVGMEASILSLVEPGDKVLNVISGVFSRWFRDIVKRHGGYSVELNFDWGKSVDTDKIAEALEADRDIRAVTVVHSETSTGALNPVQEIGRIVERHEAVLIADTISSMGGVDIPVDDWKIDACITAPQKCLGGLIGLSIVSVGEKAWERMAKRKTPADSYAFDLYKWKQSWFPKEKGGLLIKGRRSFPVLPPTHVTYALNEACKEALEEGLEKRFRRHTIASKATCEALKAMGLEIYPDESITAPGVTVLKTPQGVDDANVRRTMQNDFQVMVAGGMEELSGKTIRIGHMANTAEKSCILRTIYALGHALNLNGHRSDVDEGLNRVLEVFKEA